MTEMTPTAATRQRLLRPVGPDTYDVYRRTWLAHWSGADTPGHWSETRMGRVRLDADGRWRADYMIGRNTERYPIEGDWSSAVNAGIAVDAYSIEQGRIHREQHEYQQAHGWSTD